MSLKETNGVAHAISYSRALRSAKSLQSPQHREVNAKIFLKHVRKLIGHFGFKRKQIYENFRIIIAWMKWLVQYFV